jgi:hypothetical protein
VFVKTLRVHASFAKTLTPVKHEIYFWTFGTTPYAAYRKPPYIIYNQHEVSALQLSKTRSASHLADAHLSIGRI